MIFQRVFAVWDRVCAQLLGSSVSGTGKEGDRSKWVYFAEHGKQIGVVGVDGKIHTITGDQAVYHYYNSRNKLVKRIRAINDLREGERLATSEEISKYFQECLNRDYGGGMVA